MCLNGSGICDIARVLRVSPNTVLKTLRRHAAKLKRPRLPPHSAEFEKDGWYATVKALATVPSA